MDVRFLPEGYEPLQGDLVNVTFQTRLGSAAYRDAIDNASVVERVKSVAHPSRDEVGSIRSGLYGTLPLAKVGPDQWVQLTEDEDDIEVVSDKHMAPDFSERELLGVVPGSPAAKAVEPKVRYFREGDHVHTYWRVLPEGSVEFHFGDCEWSPSRRFGSLAELISAPEMSEVPEP